MSDHEHRQQADVRTDSPEDELMEKLKSHAREKANQEKIVQEKMESVQQEAKKERAAVATAALKALQALNIHLTHTLSGLRTDQQIGGLRGAQLEKVQSIYPQLVNIVAKDVPRSPTGGLPLPSLSVSMPPSSPRRPNTTSPQKLRSSGFALQPPDISVGSLLGVQPIGMSPTPRQASSPRRMAQQRSQAQHRSPGASGKWPQTWEPLLPQDVPSTSAPPIRRSDATQRPAWSGAATSQIGNPPSILRLHEESPQ